MCLVDRIDPQMTEKWKELPREDELFGAPLAWLVARHVLGHEALGELANRRHVGGDLLDAFRHLRVRDTFDVFPFGILGGFLGVGRWGPAIRLRRPLGSITHFR